VALTDVAIRQARPRAKPRKLRDGRGLYLEIRPNGSKLWRYRFRDPQTRKESTMSLGEYSEISLTEARDARDSARKLLKQGMHPVHERRLQRAIQATDGANTFEAVARQWLGKKGKEWTEKSRRRVERTLERDAFPLIGPLPIRRVSPQHLLTIMQEIEAKRSPTVAVLFRQWAFRIFNYAMATLKADSNPAATDIRNAITVPEPKNHPALSRHDIPGLDAALREYTGERRTVIALRLLMLTFVRSGELRGAEWSEFDLDRAEWRIPADRMKMGEAHIVPLSKQALALLKELHAQTGRQRFLFPNARRPGAYMAATTLNAALVRLGYDKRFSPHGFRGTASTLLNEAGYHPDVIERQLAHKDRNEVRAVYNKAQYLPERRAMMQQWADMINVYARGADVVPIKRTAGRQR
jgi:integrase